MLVIELMSPRNVTKVTKMTLLMTSLATDAVLVHFDLTRLKLTVSLKTDVRGGEMIKKAIKETKSEAPGPSGITPMLAKKPCDAIPPCFMFSSAKSSRREAFLTSISSP